MENVYNSFQRNAFLSPDLSFFKWLIAVREEKMYSVSF